jgi:hypothetical protein
VRQQFTAVRADQLLEGGSIAGPRSRQDVS